MAKYQMKFMFDWGSGICIWSNNAAARDKFGYPVETSALLISEELKTSLNDLISKYDEVFNWQQPSAELLWNDKQHDFLCKARCVYTELCRELGSDYENVFFGGSNMKSNYEKILSLCQKLCPNDGSKWTTSLDVRRHNRAMKEIRKKMDVICQDKAEAEEILIALMNNEHLNIQTLAAAEALRHNLLTDKAEALLEKVAAEEKGLIGFEAKMTLKVWRGEFPGNKL